MDNSGPPSSQAPMSSYLHDRLQERRARDPRPRRGRQSDFGPLTTKAQDDDIFLAEAEETRHVSAASARLYESSPLTSRRPSESLAGNGTASNTGRRRRTTFGAKEQDEVMDRLVKQNFDLKLELDHRREQQAKLKAQISSMRSTVERAEGLREEHAELLKINSQLVEELEKRDEGIREAVELICQLEERVEGLGEEVERLKASQTRPSTAQADSGYAGTDIQEASARAGLAMQSFDGARTPQRPKREPSFMSLRKGSSKALREAFQAGAKELKPVQSFNTILNKSASTITEEGLTDDVPNSPRLSDLSESSFPSIYSPVKALSPERHAWEPADVGQSVSEHRRTPASRNDDSLKRVSQWIEERQQDDATPTRFDRSVSPARTVNTVATASTRLPREDDRFQSLDNALATDRQAHGQQLEQATDALTQMNPHVSQNKRHPRTPTVFGGPMFGEPVLPPTPDSVSTRMLRGSRSSIIGERSAHGLAAMTATADLLQAGVRTAPKQMRSSVELNLAHDISKQHRSSARRHADTAAEDTESSDDDSEHHPSTAKRMYASDEDYPDGSSILNGTPSRFFKQGNGSTVPQDMFFSNTNSYPQASAADLRRRKSSYDTTPAPRKPSLSRAETSPMTLSSLQRPMPSSPPSAFARRSPSSSTTTTNTTRNYPPSTSSRSLSPEATRSGAKVSPSKPLRSPTLPPFIRRPSLGQKGKELFRRLSSSAGSIATPPQPERASDRETYSERKERDGQREREMSPLPTLTSTPSSAYSNHGSKVLRRPGSSAGTHGIGSGRPGSAQQSSAPRPSLQGRGITAPSPTAVSCGEKEAEGRKNPFRRGGSVRKAEGAEVRTNEVGAAGATGRRGSNKDVASSASVAGSGFGLGKRPWR
nr:hypothetical protein B0A51_06388 [Rachicladosporium sp. CCFEE 5018]